MLGKLLKYEIKATARSFLPLYAAIIVLALVNKIFLIFQLDYGIVFGFLALFGLFIALAIVTFVLTVTRFYKNLLSSEGYLMFTLPVQTDQLIWSKLLTAVLWMFVSCIIGVLAFILMTWQSTISWQDIFNVIREGLQLVAKEELTGVIIQFAIAVVLSCLGSVLMIYACLAIGQLPPFSNNRIAAAVVAFILLNIVLNFIELFVIFGAGFTADMGSVPQQLGMRILLSSNILSLIETIGFYITTRVILKKHLNL